MRIAARMAFPAYATRPSACSAVAPGPMMPHPDRLAVLELELLEHQRARRAHLLAVQRAPLLDVAHHHDRVQVGLEHLLHHERAPRTCRAPTRLRRSSRSWNGTAVTRASSSMRRSISVLWNSPITTPTRTTAWLSSPTCETAQFAHLPASSAAWCAKTTSSSVSCTEPGVWYVYSLGSFAFSPPAAGASRRLARLRGDRAGRAPRRAGCGVGRGGNGAGGTDAVSGRSRARARGADSEDRWRARGRTSGARAPSRRSRARGGGARGDSQCGVRRRHRVGS